MNKKVDQDEHIEQLWYMKERGEASVAFLKRVMKGGFDPKQLQELSCLGLVDLSKDGTSVTLTAEGDARARQLIRAHRLAERLIADVLGGGDLEKIACEFEHTVSLELVNGICTLLGHPKECPHGMPIPEGECCRLAKKTDLSFIIPLMDIKVGESARIAYINCKSDQQLHKLEGLCVRPGVMVKLHQTYPAYVIECEGASIALDKSVIESISVWKNFEGSKGLTDAKAQDKKPGAGGLAGFFSSIFKGSEAK
ncbi:MAG: metal-dependent transcriptional regulator [Candidatus Omnitrophica bacterium]|nr:metal-dependent transcriptional regulator [Candidatus Omnitrophota bacterium]